MILISDVCHQIIAFASDKTLNNKQIIRLDLKSLFVKTENVLFLINHNFYCAIVFIVFYLAVFI